MRLRVLGCHGGESPTHRATSFLIDDRLLLDAGAMTRGLTVAEQARVDTVFISHAHLDHIRDLALAVDNVIGVRPSPVDVYCTDPTATALERHIFNNVIWPDFTKIPNPADPEMRPTLQIHRIESGASVEVNGYKVRTVAVNHPVDCQALFVTGDSGTLVYSADTGPTDELFEALNRLDDLRALIHEVSFPNGMEELANVSGHLTPQMLAAELDKIDARVDAPILLYHFKPGFHDQLKAEVAEIGDSRLKILKPMDEIEL
jgi:3',5'-cyclic-nucleotide phosphodiesterase